MNQRRISESNEDAVFLKRYRPIYDTEGSMGDRTDKKKKNFRLDTIPLDFLLYFNNHNCSWIRDIGIDKMGRRKAVSLHNMHEKEVVDESETHWRKEYDELQVVGICQTIISGFTGDKVVSVIKLIDREPMTENNPHGLSVSVDGKRLKHGTVVGEGVFREVDAYPLRTAVIFW